MDEPEALQNVKRVSPWQVELVSTTPPLQTPFPPTKKLRVSQNPDLFTDGECGLYFPMTGLTNNSCQMYSDDLYGNVAPKSSCVSTELNIGRQSKLGASKERLIAPGGGAVRGVTTRSQVVYNGSKGKRPLSVERSNKWPKSTKDIPSDVVKARGVLVASTLGVNREGVGGWVLPSEQKAPPPPPRPKETIDLAKTPCREGELG
ncbi:hypothetical protein NE237_012586 [Protea cynaroides]|uniref:Uncharacterized protein n=1 Tax=Protea cynaroides TaxID=273540 RepID=A0A9Q0JZD2_9MAGN|nr:hypothetical protein NE237_012586 [Protea cynaroides]